MDKCPTCGQDYDPAPAPEAAPAEPAAEALVPPVAEAPAVDQPTS